MSLAFTDRWVWDSWLVDDDNIYHLFYLNAPKNSVDPELRHREAIISHAVSRDLVSWEPVGNVVTPGASDAFDATATWTGSVIRNPAGGWTLFYTGSRFADPNAGSSVQSVGVAHSPDLLTWTKATAPHVEADGHWYEKASDSSAGGEAWRDPWVLHDETTGVWHMLTTAKSKSGATPDDRGVIGHATSTDLNNWTVSEPLTQAGSGFSQLEVTNIATIDGNRILFFSCFTEHLSQWRRDERQEGGIWAINIDETLDGINPSEAYLVVPERYFCGHVVTDRSGQTVMIAFDATDENGYFHGTIADPIPLHWSEDDRAVLANLRKS
jgi:beta-fructofuranosidase